MQGAKGRARENPSAKREGAPVRKLDAIDVRILTELQADGRMSNVALAKAVGLSTTPCAERVRSLESRGIIRGYATDLEAARLGLGLTVFVEVAMERTSQDALEAFRDAVLAIAQVQECHMVAGGFDYLLKVRVQDMAAYRAFLSEALANVPGVRSTHTYPVMESVKDSRTLDLSHLHA
jgi:Lrp/AsnC family transcriptional regulator, leucine-responsive regulatory protein